MASQFQELAQLLVQVRQAKGQRTDVLILGLIDSIAIGVIAILVYFYYRWWSTHPLYGQNKGPKIYPLLGSIVSFFKNIERLPDYNVDILSKIPGHTARHVLLGKKMFITANPANVEHMLKTNFENYPRGQYIYENLRELVGDGIFNSDDRLWKIQRRQASHAFTTGSLRDLVMQVTATEATNRLIPLLRHASKSGRILDLQDIFGRFAFDNICQMGFGVDPVCLGIELRPVPIAEAFDRATVLTVDRFQTFPQFLWTVPRALGIGKPKEMRLCMRVVDEYAMEVIKNRRQKLSVASDQEKTSEGRADLLSRFMTLVDKDEEAQGEIRALLSDHQGISNEPAPEFRSSYSLMDVFLRDMVVSIIIGGRDTNTSALSWFFWLLSLHPNVEMDILEEISQTLSLRKSAPPPHAKPTDVCHDQNDIQKSFSTFSFEELKSMHYLHAALTESMRLHPPVTSNLKYARNDDVWPDGTVIEAGSAVLYHPYAMGRLEDLWGKDALEFRPDRWLKDGIFEPQSPFKYTVFHAGPRECMGKEMVMIQMKLISATILRNFKICVRKDYKPQYLAGITLSMKAPGLPVTVHERENWNPEKDVSLS